MDFLDHLDFEQIELIDRAAHDFERRLKENEAVSIGRVLEGFPQNLQSPLFRELLEVEIAFRRKRGEAIEPADYLVRFPLHADQITSILETVPQRSFDRDSELSVAGVAPLPGPIDGYEIINVLGRGGMGVVYRARDSKLKRIVALKMILAGEHAHPSQLQRFLVEAEAAARLQHPNIVQVYALGSHRGSPYLAMELVEGSSLAELIGEQPIESRRAARLCQIIARAIDYAHLNGIVHRDLKPGNILIRPGAPLPDEQTGSRSAVAHPLPAEAESVANSVSDESTFVLQPGKADRKREDRSTARTSSGSSSSWTVDRNSESANEWVPAITDFGLARTLDEDSGVTSTGEILGTPQYMSPEQARGDTEIGPASDVYAIGAILYRLLTGRTPFQGTRAFETVRMVIEDDPVSPKALQSKLSSDLSTICMKCLEKTPDQRYASAEALADDLQRWLEGKPIEARPPNMLRRIALTYQRNRTVSLVVATAVLIIVSGTVYWTSKLAIANSKLTSTNADLVSTNAELDQRRQEAEAARARANVARDEAELAGLHALAERDATRRQLVISTSRELAAQATILRYADPPLSLLLAVESVRLNRRLNLSSPPVIRQTLVNSLSSSGGLPSQFEEGISGKDMVVSSSAGWVALPHFHGRKIHLYKLHEGQLRRTASIQLKATPVSLTKSHDERKLAVGCGDGSVFLISVADQSVVELISHDNRVNMLQFSRDDQQLVTGEAGPHALVHDLSAEQPKAVSCDLSPLAERPSEVRLLKISPDGRFAAVSLARSHFVYLCPTGASSGVSPIVRLEGHTGMVTGLEISEDSQTVISTSADRTVRVWNVNQGDSPAIRSVWRKRSGRIWKAGISRDGRLLATADDDHVVTLWDLTSDDPERTAVTLHGHTARIDCIEFHPSQPLLVTGARDLTVRLWPLTGLKRNESLVASNVLRGHGSAIQAIRFTDAGDLLTGDQNDDIRFWRSDGAEQRESLFSLPLSEVRSSVARFLSDDTLVLSLPEGFLGISDVDSRSLLTTIPEPMRYANRVLAVSADRQWIAAAGVGVDLGFWKLIDGEYRLQEVLRFAKNRSRQGTHINSMAFSPDGTRLACAGWDGSVHIFEAHAKDRAATEQLIQAAGGPVNGVAFSPDGRWLAAGSARGVSLWEVMADQTFGKRIDVTTEDIQSTRVAITEDSRNLVVGFRDSSIRIWRIPDAHDRLHENGQTVFPSPTELSGHSLMVTCLALSPDGTRLASGSDDGTLRIWDLQAEDVSSSAIVLAGHTDSVVSLDYSPAGNRLASVDESGKVRLWNFDEAQLMEDALRTAGRELTQEERRRYLGSALEALDSTLVED